MKANSNISSDLIAERREGLERRRQDKLFSKISREWMIAANDARYEYQFDWLGRPIIQLPQDLVALQELYWSVKPDLVVETGIAHGGSLVFNASMLTLLDIMDGQDPRESKRRAIGVDIDIRDHNKKEIDNHGLRFKIDMVEGSSVDKNVIESVKSKVRANDRVMVILDSNHEHDHVYQELIAYAELVSVGSYCVVLDTSIEYLRPDSFPNREWGIGNNPKTAVDEWLMTNSNFEIDDEIDRKLMVSVAPHGYLRRLR